ncbi:MAG: flagellar biosynthetic protein FliQ [Kangiellaceae bacterium]|nr:flagellar biosynthetic protein FliQ [Kangiellaceae bacterium]MCW8997874.1 flagellar biosynthetic protein FliQ [Kangiellaceae bacterium]
MDIDYSLFLMGQMLKHVLLVTGPVFAVALVVGLLISIFQVVTQIQEMTLTFVPKILAVVGVLAVLGHWMLSSLVSITEFMFRSAATIGLG